MTAPPPLFSALFADAAQWDNPAPDYDALIVLLGGTAAGAGAPAVYDRNQTAAGLANLATRSPTVVAFCRAICLPSVCHP